MKLMFVMAGLFAALAAIPLSDAADCTDGSSDSSSFFSASGGAYSCCDPPFCCPDPNTAGCPLADCDLGSSCPVSGQVTVNCEYFNPGCTDLTRPEVDCQCGCKAHTDCGSTELGLTCPFCLIPDGQNSGQCVEKTCPNALQPLNAQCECGCVDDLSCVGLGQSCPECDKDTGICGSKNCGSGFGCCKATRGNDLVCANGCGRRNVCWRVTAPTEGSAVCDFPAACLASEFEPLNDGLNSSDTCLALLRDGF